ncbi:hypothetical protein SLE2022_082030 [Rubroshorea leprosula]
MNNTILTILNFNRDPPQRAEDPLMPTHADVTKSKPRHRDTNLFTLNPKPPITIFKLRPPIFQYHASTILHTKLPEKPTDRQNIKHTSIKHKVSKSHSQRPEAPRIPAKFSEKTQNSSCDIFPKARIFHPERIQKALKIESWYRNRAIDGGF